MKLNPEHPIVVDLDGTLLKTDLLYEQIFKIITQNPRAIPKAFCAIFRGKTYFKATLANLTELDPSLLPVNRRLIQWLDEQRHLNKNVFLATGSHKQIAQKVADHVGGFTDVFTTQDHLNLTGKAKAQFLVDSFGKNGFVYVGNSTDDLHVWSQAHAAILCHAGSRLTKKVSKICPNSIQLNESQFGLMSFLKEIRIHQWMKNFLIFIPVLSAHGWNQPALIVNALLAFLGFSLAASMVYIINDVVDLEHDRAHPKKSKRPLAAGDFPLAAVIPTLFLLASICLGVLLFLPLHFAYILLAYLAVTFLYSFWLKRVLLLDVVCLSILYTVRILAGGEATSIALSKWLLLFSIFSFLSLALLKRYSELRELLRLEKKKVGGRAYFVHDLHQLSALGSASAFVAVLVYCLYISSSEITQIYPKPNFLWAGSLFLIYWFSRIWILAGRGDVHEDPVIFALKDRVSLIVGVGFALFILLAT